MISKTSIFFHLDDVLKIYLLSTSVNLKWQTLKVLEKENNRLNLATKFEKVMHEIFPKIVDVENFYLVLGNHSGFTDSRIIFLWLAMQKNFYPEKKLFTIQAENIFDLTHLQLESLNYLLESAVENQLVYTRKPKIGKKKTRLPGNFEIS